jgi:hypothetical protein
MWSFSTGIYFDDFRRSLQLAGGTDDTNVAIQKDAETISFCFFPLFFVMSLRKKFDKSSSSLPLPFVPLQRRGCLVAPWFL